MSEKEHMNIPIMTKKSFDQQLKKRGEDSK